MRPLIGITTESTTNRYGQPITQLTEVYSRAVTEAGGMPLLIPKCPDASARSELFGRLDGILFSGGGDLEPRRYGSVHAESLIGVDTDRDELELELIRRAIEGQRPFLGICRGCQLLNVALGGTLYPDLASKPAGRINHNLPGSERDVLVHEVAIEPGTSFERILGQPVIRVNSHHHQGIQALASGLRVAGRAPDDLVEAVEVPGHAFGLAVQWHPEWLAEQPATRNLFRSFVEACANAR